MLPSFVQADVLSHPWYLYSFLLASIALVSQLDPAPVEQKHTWQDTTTDTEQAPALSLHQSTAAIINWTLTESAGRVNEPLVVTGSW